MTEQTNILDLGVSLRIEVQENNAAIDISTSTARAILLTKPDGSQITRTAVYVTDGTDGQIEYVTVSGDIDQLGNWQYRGRVTFGATQVYHTKAQTFKVVN